MKFIRELSLSIVIFGSFSGFAEECSLRTMPLPCDVFEKNEIKSAKNFSESLKFQTNDKPKLNCGLYSADDPGFKNLMKIEAARLAPWLQKLQAFRNDQKLTLVAEKSAELEKLERIIRRNTFFSYANNLDEVADQLKKEKVWNSNRPSQAIEKKLTDSQIGLEKNAFPDALFKEIGTAKALPETCLRKSPEHYLLMTAAKKSPRWFHFNKVLLGNYPTNSIQVAAEKCVKKTPEKPEELCKLSKDRAVKFIESELDEQLCVLKELSPTFATQLPQVRLEIPSVAGVPVTEGLGPRPSEEEAKSKDFRLNVLCPEDVSFGGLARGALGAAASMATHELSHEGVGLVLGKSLKWNAKAGTWLCQNCDDTIKPIAIAGLASHSLSSEYLVQNQDNDSQFQKGWLFFNILNTSQYFVKDWLARSGKISGDKFGQGLADKNGSGDLRAFSKKQSYMLGAAMVGHQLYSGYRYLEKRQNYQCKKD